MIRAPVTVSGSCFAGVPPSEDGDPVAGVAVVSPVSDAIAVEVYPGDRRRRHSAVMLIGLGLASAVLGSVMVSTPSL